ncbi:MAG: hypothetical protein J6I60_06345 [Bacteroidaceae bacterium]|nr:hypothetical protein [Bacteroidaceae bacterium]
MTANTLHRFGIFAFMLFFCLSLSAQRVSLDVARAKALAFLGKAGTSSSLAQMAAQ